MTEQLYYEASTLPPRDEFKPDTPLRLSVAAALAFLNGSMTASRLRREGAEHVAGRQHE
jgi:hypothetical protein